MVQIALLLDEDVRPLLGEILRQRGYDVLHVLDIDRCGLTDNEQLEYAVRDRRAILTHNVKDFILLDKHYREQNREHFGILLAEQAPLRVLLRRTLRFISRHSADDVNGNLFWIAD
jgi:predicted nuclease of predicted toxin-antitoxin system